MELESEPTYTLDSLTPGKTSKSVTVSRQDSALATLNIWLLLIILIVIVGVILYFSHPGIVMSRNPQTNQLYIDWGKLVLWSIGIAIAVVLLIWIFKGLIGYNLSY